jgi:hypothetical protein
LQTLLWNFEVSKRQSRLRQSLEKFLFFEFFGGLEANLEISARKCEVESLSDILFKEKRNFTVALFF